MFQPYNILRIARRESDALDEELRRLLIKDFPSSGPKGALEVLRTINGKTIKDIERRAKIVANGYLSDKDADTFVSLPLKLYPLFHHLLENIDRAVGHENPYGMLSLFTRLIERFETNVEVVLKPQWQFSYDICDITGALKFINEDLLKEQCEPAEVFQKRLVVLSYPTSHRNSAFIHPVQGHEIGRLFDRISGISSRAIEMVDPQRCHSESKPKNLVDMLRSAQYDDKYEVMGMFLKAVKNWTEVVVADVFSITVFGTSYLFALNELLTVQGTIAEGSCEKPSGAFRIVNLLRIMDELGFTNNLEEAVRIRIDEIASNVNTVQKSRDMACHAPVLDCLERCLSMEGEGIGYEIFKMVREKTEGFAYEPQRLLDEVPGLVKLMEGMVPPIELFDEEGKDSKPADIISIMNAGWIVYLTRLGDVCKNFSAETEEEQAQVLDILNLLLLKAMEVNEICEKLSKERERPNPSLEILNYMYPNAAKTDASQGEDDLFNRLFITPLLKPALQLGNLSVDLRLGNEFIVPMKTKYPVLDPSKYGRYRVAEVEEYQEKIFKRYGEPFVLHPGQFVLGCTLEFIRLPNCFSAYIIGRSSWGRLGLTIATAIAIDPGYSGVLTLELLNSGETPIVLYPGARIAQLILHKQTPSSLGYSRKKFSKYKFPISVEFSKIRGDADWEDLKKIGNRL